MQEQHCTKLQYSITNLLLAVQYKDIDQAVPFAATTRPGQLMSVTVAKSRYIHAAVRMRASLKAIKLGYFLVKGGKQAGI